MKADQKTEAEIVEMLDNYTNTYADKDLDGMMNLFLDHHDLVVIGTGEDEWVHGFQELKDGLKRDISQSESIKVEFKDLIVSSVKNVAWASSYMTMHVQIEGEKIVLVGRMSAVFEKIGDKWYFVHLHYSLPAEAQKEGKSFPETK